MQSLRATRFRRAGLLLPLLLASACAALPNVGPKPLPRAESDYASSASFSGPQSAWPADGWWSRYGDAQLDQLMTEGLAGSPNLAAAAARFRRAQGLAQAAGAALLPSIGATASASEQKAGRDTGMPAPRGWYETGSAAGVFSFDLDLWGKNRAALRAAKKDAEAAEFNSDEARLALTTGIASAYADLAAPYAQRDNLESALDIRAQTLKLVQQRVTAGLDSDAELRQAQARIPQTNSDLAATDEAILNEKHAIAELVGAGPDRALSITRPAIAALQSQGVPADASTDLIGRRPDIAAARARVEAAGERIKQARAAFYPDINLTALVGFQALGLGNLFKSGSKFASATPAVSLPLFEGGALQGQYRGRRGEYDEAVALYNGQVIQALHETADAVTSEQMLARRLTESRSALAAYEDALRLARLRYEHGLSTYLDVLTAQESVVSARLTVAELETRAFTLDVQLVRALGGGFATSPQSTGGFQAA